MFPLLLSRVLRWSISMISIVIRMLYSLCRKPRDFSLEKKRAEKLSMTRRNGKISRANSSLCQCVKKVKFTLSETIFHLHCAKCSERSVRGEELQSESTENSFSTRFLFYSKLPRCHRSDVYDEWENVKCWREIAFTLMFILHFTSYIIQAWRWAEKFSRAPWMLERERKVEISESFRQNSCLYLFYLLESSHLSTLAGVFKQSWILQKLKLNFEFFSPPRSCSRWKWSRCKKQIGFKWNSKNFAIDFTWQFSLSKRKLEIFQQKKKNRHMQQTSLSLVRQQQQSLSSQWFEAMLTSSLWAENSLPCWEKREKKLGKLLDVFRFHARVHPSEGKSRFELHSPVREKFDKYIIFYFLQLEWMFNHSVNHTHSMWRHIKKLRTREDKLKKKYFNALLAPQHNWLSKIA